MEWEEQLLCVRRTRQLHSGATSALLSRAQPGTRSRAGFTQTSKPRLREVMCQVRVRAAVRGGPREL